MIDARMVSFLREEYGVEVTASVSLAASGKRQAYRLMTQSGELILKMTDPGREESVVQSDVQILQYLAQYDFPSARVVSARDGQLYLPYGDQYLYLYTYIDGCYPRVTASLYPRLGALLARLHSIPFENFGRISPYQPVDLLVQMKDRLLQIQDRSGQELMVNDLLERIERFPSFEGLPKGLIHTDPYFVNMLEDPRGRLCLIDWDDAGISYPLLDVGYIGHLSTFLPHDRQKWNVVGEGEVSWFPQWAQLFLDGYQSVRPLSALEKDLFPCAVWLNFLVYSIDWDQDRIIIENYQRMKILETFRPQW